MQTQCTTGIEGRGRHQKHGLSGHDWSGLERLRPGLRKWLGRKCADENEVEDVIQETFIRAARYRSSKVGDRGLTSWVRRIAANVCNDRGNQSMRSIVLMHDDRIFENTEGREPEPGALGDHDRMRVGGHAIAKATLVHEMNGSLDRLSATDRHVLTSFYGGAQSCAQTAIECDMGVHLVKVQLFRARRRLASVLQARLRGRRW
ncbi:MAG: RNA polymerase sigma factor (sigma-70 family) [Planctomycetota bacterium]